MKKKLPTALTASINLLAILSCSATLISSVAAQELGSSSGTKFNDLNANGIRDNGEPILEGWEMELIDFDGDVIATTTTNTSGFYEFTNLEPGPYVVREVPRLGWRQTLPNFVTDLELGQITGDWNYDDPNNDWPLIAPDAGGNFQSPIDITGTDPIDLSGFLDINYSGEHPEYIKNTGKNFDLEYESGNGNLVNLYGKEFELAQFHFHYESEHALDGTLSEMELHFVNRHEDGGLTVLGILIEEGNNNQDLAPIFDAVNDEITANGELPELLPFTEDIDLLSLVPDNLNGWLYNGSLTTPPATEGVNWFVFEDSLEMSSEQINIFQDFLATVGFTINNRPVQPLNGRQFNQLNYQVTVNGDSIDNLNFGNVVPEPLTILGSGLVAGLLPLFKKQKK